MPKVLTQRVVLDGAREKDLDFKYDIYVNNEGVFSTTLPQNIVNLFKEGNINMQTNRMKTEGYLTGNTMDELKNSVKAICQEYLSRTLTSEKIIIRYAIETTCSYVLDKDGNIYPNGTDVPGFNESAFWKEGTVTQHATERHAFGILIYAKPFWRRDYSYRSGANKTEYKEWTAFGGSEAGDNPSLKWLEGVPSIAPPPHCKVKEIDYTEPVAAFFVSLLLSMCRLNERIKDFLEPDTIQELVDKKLNLLS